MIRNFFIGFIRIHILYHASKRPIYGLWMIEELGRHGYTLSPGTLYPILKKLENEGWLKSIKKKEAGKIRKYYRITSKGRGVLQDARVKIRELVDEVLHEGG